MHHWPLRFLFAVFIFGAAAHGNVVGTDFQNFNPTPQGLDFVTVHSSETLQPGIINMGLFLNLARNSLPYVQPEGSTMERPEDSLLGLDLSLAVGLSENWDIGVSLPQLVWQSVEPGANVQLFSSRGLTEVRLNSKYRVWGDRSQGLAIVATGSMNTIANNPFMGSDPGPSTTLELVADTTVDKIALGANVGYRFRTPGDPIPGVPFEPISDQIIASLAASYFLESYDSKIITEIYGGWPQEGDDYERARALSSLEINMGIKHDINSHLAFHAGGGTGLRHATATPDWRVYTGLSYAIGPFFKSDPEADSGFETVKVDPPAPVSRKRKGKPEKEPITAPYEQRTMTSDVLFAFDSDKMKPESFETFKRLVKHLRSSEYQFLLIEGHTDSIGNDAYNLDLSRRRALRVRRFLVDKFGIEADKIRTIGYGETRPIADNGNYQGRQLNRRVDFKIKRKKPKK